MVKSTETSSSSYLKNLFEFKGKIFFSAVSDDGRELWASDGTSDGTILVKDFLPSGNGDPTNFFKTSDRMYFQAESGGDGVELWFTDGTSGGTTRIKDINPGTDGSYPYFFGNIGSIVLFVADTPTTGREIFKTDGTETGTILLKDLNPGPDGSFSDNSRK